MTWQVEVLLSTESSTEMLKVPVVLYTAWNPGYEIVVETEPGAVQI
jgi:hypothetical protein